MRGEGGARPPYLAVGLLSAAALAYEVLLTRLFALIQWHHYAFMMVSVAMLGWGAAGTLVTLAGDRLQRHFRAAFAAAAALFGVSAVVCFLVAQAVAFNPMQALWDARAFLPLALIYLCLFLPFLAAATALCLAFSRHGSDAPRLYAADILGAGLGGLAVVGLLWLLPPMRALAALGAVGLAAAAIAWGPCRRGVWALLAAAVLLALLPATWLKLEPSEYKDLAQALRVIGTRVVAETSGPLGVITAVESPRVPLRLAAGLSLAWAAEPPPQLGLFIDGDGPIPVTRFDGDLRSLAYLDGLTSALSYHLLDRPRVLVLGAGSGEAVLQALYHGARAVDAVEPHARLVDLVEGALARYSGRPFHQPGVRVHRKGVRAFVAGSRTRYDLIKLDLVDAGAAAGGVTALSAGDLYTVEAFVAYLDRLAPGGLIAITRWAELPPRDLLKLAATAIAALEAEGVADPGRRLAMIRGWKTGTLLVKNGPFTAAEIERLKAFCRARWFDVAWYPGMRAEEANRYHLLERPYHYEAMAALLGPGRAEFLARYKYRLEPATDDRPYFHHFFKWESLAEWWRLRARGGMSLMEWGYPVLLATLTQAVLAGAALILLPLALAGRQARGNGVRRGRALAYFALLGLAFMFVEIAFIQRFMLFLGHPLYAVAVVLAGFLVFAGLGSRLAAALTGEATRIVRRATVAIATLALTYLLLLPPLFQSLAGLADSARIAVSLALISPLAMGMGMPFPLGLRLLSETAPDLIPWAWGINAYLSVVAAVLATLLAVHLGFSAVVVLAVLGYLSAGMLMPMRMR